MDRLVQMLDRLDAMAVEIVLGDFQMMLGSPHRLQRFVDVRMPFGTGATAAGAAGAAAGLALPVLSVRLPPPERRA